MATIMCLGNVPIIRCAKGNAAEMVAEVSTKSLFSENLNIAIDLIHF